MQIAVHPQRWFWRTRLAWILIRKPFNWPMRSAWEYAGSLREYNCPCSCCDEVLSPRDALDEDMQHWEAD